MTTQKTWGFGLVCILAATLGGCYRHTFVVGKGGNVDADPNKSFWQSHWVGGLIGGSEVDVARVCPSGNATLKDNMSFLNSLVSSLLLGIYTPTTVEVYCGEGKSATLQLDGSGLRAIARAPATLEWARRVSPQKAAELEEAIAGDVHSSRDVASSHAPSAF